MTFARLTLLLGLLAAVSASAEDAAQQGPNPDHEGYALYQRFCASCHGVHADGKGPRAAAVSPPPADLRHLASTLGGPPTLDELTRIIDGRRTVRAHGEGRMPVWGEELAADVPDAEMREKARIRLVQSLAEYVLSIQLPAGGAQPPPTSP